MFYQNLVPHVKSNRKVFKYDLFAACQNQQKDDFVRKASESKLSYNFISENGCLESGYGFSKLKSPTSKTDLESEEEVATVGDILGMWNFKYYNKETDENEFYLLYFNGTENFRFDDLFDERPIPFFIPTTFTSTPTGSSYRVSDLDVMVFSGEGSALQVVGANFNVTVENAPKLISICPHYDKLFAITDGARSSLVYTENTDLLKWDNNETKHITFSDERGNLNKIISFNDYLYLFRDFGITKVSTYSTKSEFSISHLYQADGYIYPGSIASAGDKIFFLERSGLKVFNGSSTKDISLGCTNLLTSENNANACGVAFEGKYYLACRAKFADDKKIGCENGSYKNNVLFVYDQASGSVEITRGIDINQLLVLNNPYKSKLIACFNNDNKQMIGQLEKNGCCFEQALPKEWKSVKTDFDKGGVMKKITSLSLISHFDCQVTIKSEREEKTIAVSGSEKPQRIKLSLLGEIFEISISCQGKAKISNFQIEYLERT